MKIEGINGQPPTFGRVVTVTGTVLIVAILLVLIVIAVA